MAALSHSEQMSVPQFTEIADVQEENLHSLIKMQVLQMQTKTVRLTITMGTYLIINILFFLIGFIYQALPVTGEEVYLKSCKKCHILKTTPYTENAGLKAPPFNVLVRQIKYYYRDEEKFTEFVIDYLDNPSIKKSICKPCIQRWGLMPPINSLSDEEKKAVARWLFIKYR